MPRPVVFKGEMSAADDGSVCSELSNVYVVVIQVYLSLGYWIAIKTSMGFCLHGLMMWYRNQFGWNFHYHLYHSIDMSFPFGEREHCVTRWRAGWELFLMEMIGPV